MTATRNMPTRLRCPEHDRPLAWNEATEEAFRSGNLSFEVEECYWVETYVCVVPGCRESRRVTRR